MSGCCIKEILPFSLIDSLNFASDSVLKMKFITETEKEPPEPVDSGLQTVINKFGLYRNNSIIFNNNNTRHSH